MGKLGTLIWYAILLVFFLIMYYVGSGFTVALVDDGFAYMSPTLPPKTICLLDRRGSTARRLDKDDVIAFQIFPSAKGQTEPQRWFGRVLARAGATLSVRGGRLLADGTDVGPAPKRLKVLETDLLVPRATVFVGFDSSSDPELLLADRLVPLRTFLGRVMGKQ